jgi:hypothetical protein
MFKTIFRKTKTGRMSDQAFTVFLIMVALVYAGVIVAVENNHLVDDDE